MDFDFVANAAERASALGMLVSRSDSANQVDVSPWQRAPIWLRVESLPDRVVARGVVRAYGLSGNATDIHDTLGSLWTLILLAAGGTSIYVEDVPHPVAEFESQCRIILLAPFDAEDKPLVNNRVTFEWFARIMAATATSAPILTASFDHPHPESMTNSRPGWTCWVAGITGDNVDDPSTLITNRLEGAVWQYYRGFESGITVYRLTPGIICQCRELLATSAQAMRAVSCRIQREVDILGYREEFDKRTALALQVSMVVDRVLGAVGGASVVVALTRSHGYVLGETNMVEVTWSADGGDVGGQ